MFNTIETHKERPLFRRSDIGDVPAPVFAKRLASWGCDLDKTSHVGEFQPAGTVRADRDAVRFYAMNHVTALIGMKNTGALSGDETHLVDLYARAASRMAMRAVAYVFLITTREARHFPAVKVASLGGVSPELRTYFENRVCGKSWDTVVKRTLTKPPDVPVREYLAAVHGVFKHSYWSGKATSFGGDKWANVTKALIEFVTGNYSPEMFLDTVWTLQHNGGPIFNKGMLYDGYDHATLTSVLDVQAKGLVPAYVLNGKIASPDPMITEYLKMASALYPELKDMSGAGKLAKYGGPGGGGAPDTGGAELPQIMQLLNVKPTGRKKK